MECYAGIGGDIAGRVQPPKGGVVSGKAVYNSAADVVPTPAVMGSSRQTQPTTSASVGYHCCRDTGAAVPRSRRSVVGDWV